MLAAAGGRSAAARRPPPEVEVPPLASRRRRSAAPSDDEPRLPRQAPATAWASSRVADMAGRRPASCRLCGTLEKARKAKRGSDITRSSGENRKDHETESLIFGHLHGDPNEDIWTGLSDDKKLYLSKSVISITLCDGNTNLFSCSGIAIDRQGNHLTSFLTSASLVKNLRGTPSKGYFNVKINVCDEGNEVHEGFLAGFDSDHNFAVVNVRTFLDVQCVLQHVLKIPLHGDALLVALGRNNSGELTTRTVKLSGNLRVCKDDKDCGSKISEALDGGPLFSFDGSFVGMNLFFYYKRSLFPTMGSNFQSHGAEYISCTLGFFEGVQVWSKIHG